MGVKRNILLVSRFGSLQGGGQRSILLLLKNIDRQRFNPLLLCSENGPLADAARDLGLKVGIIPCPSLRSLHWGVIGQAWRRYVDFVKENNIHLVHTNCPRLTFFFGFIARRYKIPLVFHVRVSDPEPIVVEWLLGTLSTKIVVVSKGARRRFERLGSLVERTTVVYNAVDTTIFSPVISGDDFRRSLNANGVVLIGILGQIIPLKGQGDFIRAAAEILKEQQPCPAKFVVMGNDEGGYQQVLVELARELGIEKDIHFFPFQENMPQVMAALDILVNASDLEGFSRVVIEAMSCGKPVIATAVGGNPEAVEHHVTGLLIAPHDPAGMATAMKELIADPSQRQRMGMAARQKVLDKFSIERTVRQIEGIYEGCTGNT